VGAVAAGAGLAGQPRAKKAYGRAPGRRIVRMSVWGACSGEREAVRTCGRKATGRRVEAHPAAGLGDLPWRHPLVFDPVLSGRVRLTLALPGPQACAGQAESAGMSF
jgi:hypothetical protein